MKVNAGGFPKPALRLFGACHLLGGILLLVLGFAQLGVTGRDEEDIWAEPAKDRWRLYLYYPSVAILFSGIMMVTAGLLGIGAPMSYNPHRQAAMVSGFKLMTILVAIIFGPIVFGIGLTYAHLFDTDEDVGAIGLVICIFGGLQTFIAMCGSCMTCCYSPYNSDPLDFLGREYGLGEPRFGDDFSPYGARPFSGPPSLDFRGRGFPRRF